MGVGRIEIVDGKKQYVPYAGLGGGVIIWNQNKYTLNGL